MRPSTPIAMLALAFAAGCAPRAPIQSPPDDNFNIVWDTATEVLREYRFDVDRTDRRAGVITTLPLISRHWFEFWRKDAVTAYDVVEGSVQTVYRQATITIRRYEPATEPGSEPATGPELSAPAATAPAAPATMPATMPIGDYYVTVEVRNTRSDLPVVQATNASEAIEVYTGAIRLQRTATPTTQPVKQVYRDEFANYVNPVRVDLGRDEPLEKVMQRRINSLAARRLTLIGR